MKTKAQMIRAEPKIRMPGLAQPLAEELEDPAGVDLAGDLDAEAGDLAEGVEPAARGRRASRSPDRLQLGVGGEQDRGDDELEEEDGDEGDDHRLVDGPADAGGAARRRHPLVGADDATIAPNIVHIRTEDQMSVTVALVKSVAKKPPSDWW